MNLRACCLLAAALAAPACAAFGPTGSCIRVDPVYARMAAATGGQVMRVRPDEMEKMQPFMIPQLLRGRRAIAGLRHANQQAAGGGVDGDVHARLALAA